MNIGIVVHSSTGTTKAFGALIAAELRKSGHHVEETVLATDVPIKGGSVRQHREFKITNLPDCGKYDVVLVGGPVWAFSASPVIIAAIKGLAGLMGKRVLPFATMGFPFQWMGGDSALSLMSRTAAECGAKPLPGVVARKLFHDFKKEVKEKALTVVTRIR